MNNTLTLPQFAQMVASSAGISVDEAQTFITALTDHVKNMLAAGEKVSLPGIGTFAAIDTLDGNVSVIFAPEDSFADAVNEPFAMFEPVELMDNAELDIAESDLSPADHDESTECTAPTDDEASIASESVTAADEIIANADTDVTDASSDTVTDGDAEPLSDTEQPTADTEQPLQSAITPEVTTGTQPTPVVISKPSRQYRLGWLCTGIVIGFIIGYLVSALIYTQKVQYGDTEYDTQYEEEYIEPTESQADAIDTDNTSVSEAATTPSEVPTSTILCQDTVTAKRYITHMAKDYYGDRTFWVYIYEANKEVLGHPERTLPGTVVNIPTPASIPANPSEPDDIRRARALAAEIYSRFQ